MAEVPSGNTPGLEEKLRAFLSGRRAVVLGVGNALRGDDGFGPAVIERLRAACGVVRGPRSGVRGSAAEEPTTGSPQPGTRNPEPRTLDPVVVLNAETAPENFTGRIRRERPEALLVLDAADFGGAPGELRLLAPGELAAGGFSTHAGSLTMLCDYLRAECATDSAVLAVQAGALEFGAAPLAPVAAAVERAAELVRSALSGPPRV